MASQLPQSSVPPRPVHGFFATCQTFELRKSRERGCKGFADTLGGALEPFAVPQVWLREI